ncbi:collagen alpha-2(I) chain-like [Poecile atricapillus]|uniref:collagen alpha-2(I) chain-like n=1 Tax=Poecile atricapillus TaxID=48891 RepID=UPI00273A384A|nr:collagen alpha-2(I) chain-like [Poecile atricapillus]
MLFSVRLVFSLPSLRARSSRRSGIGTAESRWASGPGPRCGAASGSRDRDSFQVRGGDGTDRCLPRPGERSRSGGVPDGPGAGALRWRWAPARKRGSIKDSGEQWSPAPDGRAEGWVFAGEMRGSCLQLAYKVPVLGSRDLPGAQRAKTERGGAAGAARGRSGGTRGPARAARLGGTAGAARAALGERGLPGAGAGGCPGSPRAENGAGSPRTEHFNCFS